MCIHAGWKGLGMGIIEEAINKINSSNDLIVWLGPCISQENFEVGHDVYEFFNKYDLNGLIETNSQFIRSFFDLS